MFVSTLGIFRPVYGFSLIRCKIFAFIYRVFHDKFSTIPETFSEIPITEYMNDVVNYQY